MDRRRRIALRAALAATVWLSASSLFACEPIFPLAILIAGPMALVGSLIALPITIGLKALLFARFQHGLRFIIAVLLMIAGNLLSSVVGLIAAAMIATPSAWMFGLPIIFGLCYMPSKHAIAALSQRWIHEMHPASLSFLMTAALFGSVAVFGLSQAAIAGNNLAAYWIIKLAWIYVALIVSILLSAFWEEWVIWRLSRSSEDETFFAPVLRANIYVLLLIMLVAAGIMLPRRLKSGDFLVQLLRPGAASVSR